MTLVDDAMLLSLRSYDYTSWGGDLESAAIRSFNALSIHVPRTDFVDEANAAGFGAIVYQRGSEIVIAFRGTDDFLDDPATGWGTGAGAATSTQALLAVEFYQTVINSIGVGADVTITGHSMGGGLAGYVAGLYGRNAIIFDNMDYDTAVLALYSSITQYHLWVEGVAADGEASPYFESLMLYGQYYSNLSQSIYGNGPISPPNLGNIVATHIDGEAVELLRSNASDELSLGDGVPLSPIDRHMLDLLIIRRAMSVEQDLDPEIAAVGKYIFPALFDDTIAETLSFDDPSKMRTSIALSIGTGPEALLSFKEDASHIGNASAAGLGGGADAGNDYSAGMLTQLARVSAQYSGYVAKFIDATGNGSLLAGILSYDPSHGVVHIDYSPHRWSELGASPIRLVGLDEMIDLAVHTDLGFAVVDDFGAHLNRYLWAESTGEIWTTTVVADFSGSEVKLDEAVGGIQALFGSQAADVLVGSEGDDVIFVGRAEVTDAIFDSHPDYASGGAGFDLLVGNVGSDILIGGEDGDYLIGAAGNDIMHGGRPVGAEDEPFWDPIMGQEYTPLTVDYSEDTILAGAGDDIVYISGGGDIVDLGDGNDRIYIERTDEPAYVTSVIWGGEGADEFYFNTDCRVLFAYCDELTPEIFANLDIYMLSDYLSSDFYADYIIFNVEDDDSIFIGGNEIGLIREHSYTLRSETEEFFGYANTGEVFNGKPIFAPSIVVLGEYYTTSTDYTSDGTSTGLRVEADTIESIPFDSASPVEFEGQFYNEVEVNYPDHEGKVELIGFQRGQAGVDFSASSYVTQAIAQFATYEINVTGWDPDHFDEWSSRVYAQEVEYDLGTLVEAISGNGHSEERTLPDNFDAAGRILIDLTKFQLELGDAGNNEGTGGPEPGSFVGGGGGDVYLAGGGNDQIDGGSGNDSLYGEDGADFLFGGSGDDLLDGGAGNDILMGSDGSDILIGGAGSDTFIFQSGFGHDIVSDIDIDDGDVIELYDGLFGDFEELINATSQVGNDTLITYDAQNTITLKNVAMTSLHQDDFRFVA